MSTNLCVARVTEQLRRLQVDHVDLYLFGGLGEEDVNSISKVKKQHFLEWTEEKMAQGKIGHLGFSFHGRYDAFTEIVDSYDGWSFCQMIFNYLDAEVGTHSPGLRALRYAAHKGLAVVAMEPIQG
ncbi:aldo/keto reductase [Candidatus Bathyarchaeota archaeon]|nr:aldo/keto reductase [Candidatus Bathyarchaeota archaeon]